MTQYEIIKGIDNINEKIKLLKTCISDYEHQKIGFTEQCNHKWVDGSEATYDINMCFDAYRRCSICKKEFE